MISQLPLPNRLSNNLGTLGGIQALLQWEPTLFDGFSPPAPIDKQGCLDMIMLKYGSAPLYYPNPTYLKYNIGAWSRRNQKVWADMYETTQYEYNAIHNYDRTEEFSEQREGTNKNDKTYNETINRSGDEDTTNNRTINVTNEGESTDIGNAQSSRTSDKTDQTINTVSADNSDVWQNDNKSDGTSNDTVKEITDNTVDTTTKSTSDTTDSDTGSRDWKDNSTRGGTDNDSGQYQDNVTHTLRAFGNIGVTTTQDMIAAQREIVQFTIEEFIADSFKKTFCLEVW